MSEYSSEWKLTDCGEDWCHRMHRSTATYVVLTMAIMAMCNVWWWLTVTAAMVMIVIGNGWTVGVDVDAEQWRHRHITQKIDAKQPLLSSTSFIWILLPLPSPTNSSPSSESSLSPSSSSLFSSLLFCVQFLAQIFGGGGAASRPQIFSFLYLSCSTHQHLPKAPPKSSWTDHNHISISLLVPSDEASN